MLIRRAICIFAVLAIPAAGLFADCVVCRAAECEPSIFGDFGGEACEVRCIPVSGPNGSTYLECACRTIGDCSGDHSGGPIYDGEPSYRLPASLAEQVAPIDRVVHLLAGAATRRGPFTGQVAIKSPEGEILALYPYRGEATFGSRSGDVTVTIDLEDYPPVRHFELQVWNGGQSGFLTVEAGRDGETRSYSLGG